MKPNSNLKGRASKNEHPLLNSDDISLLDIDAYIARIEASSILGRSKRRIRLLDHLIKSEFWGHGEQLKAYSIGLDIFGKSDEFDPASDSVVRVEMGRLRTALALFEASEFADTRIVVEIPIGTYRPAIKLRDPTDGDAESQMSTGTPQKHIDGKNWGMLALILAVIFGSFLTLRSLMSPSAIPSTLGVQISLADPITATARDTRSSLAQALSRSKVIKLFEPTPEGQSGSGARFDVKLSVSELGGRHRATFELMELPEKRLIWSTTLSEDTRATLITSVENKVARELRVRLFGASKAFLETLDPDELSPEALFVLATWVPGVAQSAVAWEETRIDFARQAIKEDPEFGAAHSVLADKLSYLANVYGPADTEDNRAAALFHAHRAMDLSPLDPDVVFNVAQSHWHAGRVAESRAIMARVLELDDGHDLARFLHMVIPYTCAMAPDDVVKQAIEFDAGLSADNPIRWLTLTWIGWLHAYREEWVEALVAEEAAARIFQIPYTFVRRAMILNRLGRQTDAATVISQQKKNWNGFDLAHYVNTTIPRLCSETSEPEVFIGYYTSLLTHIDAP